VPNEPVQGLYERLVTEELSRLLSLAPSQALVEPPDPGDAHIAVARHLLDIIVRALSAIPEPERLERQADLCNALLTHLRESQPDGTSPDVDRLVRPLMVLREVKSHATGLGGSANTRRPLVPLSAPDLLVNARGEPSVGVTIEHEIPSADRIDLLCAFVRWTGLRIVQSALEDHCRAGRPLRVITTVYTGSTERRALDWLSSIGAEVRVSYDTRTTRLHAKAWLFERLSGFSTAYIGSSNLTHSAMLDGVEWNVRLAQASTPSLLDKFRAAFDSYWADPDYESYDSVRDADRFDRAVQATTTQATTPDFFFDLRPWPFQREMLDRLQTERERHHRYRNLVVAATGTGKTIVAAFDYQRLRGQYKDASLLFIAHRREILSQSLAAYRAVLRDGAFGELLVDGQRPQAGRHVFASVQSLAQVDLAEISPESFDVVVVDEFHHAAAPTYTRILTHLKPRILLGLTATPERTDGESVLDWFDGRIAVELRLWDALDRGLLCPFQYFGLHDGTDLSGLHWSRRGYDIPELENLYTGNHARVSLILQAIKDKVTNPLTMRALGFCVSVAHARFMAAECSRRGLPSVAVSAETPGDLRDTALRSLRDGSINVVFCVDLFNEGVDLPQVDTVLFLRPTESALVFLQQLGRGLRRSETKSCLTVLDFIGHASRNFRFDLRLRALVGGHRADIIRQVQDGFPRIPSGCSIQLDRVATQVVLENVRQSIGGTFASLLAELRSLADSWTRAGRDPARIGLSDFLEAAALDVTDVYRGTGWTWSRLKREAGLSSPEVGPDEVHLCRALSRLLHIDDPHRLNLFRRAVTGSLDDSDFDLGSANGRALMGLHFLLWPGNEQFSSLQVSIERLRMNHAVATELDELFGVLEDTAAHIPEPIDAHMEWSHHIPLSVHSRVSLVEIMAAFGKMTFARRQPPREGVYFDRETSTDLLFITLDKVEKHYSPTTMYRDYAISPNLFHWESQSITSDLSPTGQRYIGQKRGATNVFLFVRHQKMEGGRTAPYTFLGAADYVSHQGSRPIAITWRLRKPMPDDLFRVAKVAAG
jgi:superfamily II DNA or RNA helicase